ncbi:hypothetical protein BLNAU_21850 [Blattamonas nauphoetae]|uniref:Uncharacterized protein n=1 Tax=Blattamonas nauphoetae TaxID=2049346 RepID=A0ABQ9WVS1_9EUKA|nr:hypothetical protein BLNAU_21850 [Blattamonas nauphoetae]
MKERGISGQRVLLAGQRGSDPVRDELYAMIVKQTNEFECSASGSGVGEASAGKKGKKKEVWETMTDEERMGGWSLYAWMADTFLPTTAFQRGVLAYLQSRVEAGRAEGAGRAEKLAGVMARVVFSKMCVTLFFGLQRRAAEIGEQGPDEWPTQLVEEGCCKKGKEHLLFVELVPNAGFEKIGSLAKLGTGGSGKEGKKEKKEEGERVVQALFHSNPLTPPRWLSPLEASMNRFVELGGLETEGVFRRTVAESNISAAAALINAFLFWVQCGEQRKTRPDTDTSQPTTPQPSTKNKSKAKEKKMEKRVSPAGMLVPSCLSFLAVTSADTLSDQLLFLGQNKMCPSSSTSSNLLRIMEDSSMNMGSDWNGWSGGVVVGKGSAAHMNRRGMIAERNGFGEIVLKQMK